MSDQPFVHLHVHTEFSLLDGLSRIDQLVARARDLNMPSLAITDHGAMFGVIDFFRACKKAGVKPIIGMEGYLARRTMYDRDPKEDKRAYHLLLLAKNATGYQNLLKIASTAQLEGYYYRPRIDRAFLAQHADGLVATSGCLAAQIPSLVMEGKDDEARELIGWYQDVFGQENFFLELQQHDIPELFTVNKWLVEYERSHHTRVPLLATNDVHYVLRDDYDPHDTLLCIQTGALKSETDRLRMSDASYYLTSAEEMWGYFHEVPQALHNTMRVAEMCEVQLEHEGYHLPVFPVPEGFDAGSYLRHLCEKGLEWRYGSHAHDPEIQKRLNHELTVIHDMGFDTYFLIVWDLCEYARHADIWWNVRGSGAGSVVAYSLGITSIDPIQNNLLFERFLNPGRVSMPDIDIDFPDDRRGDMITYTAMKYGEDKVAAIITFGTLGAKAAVRDVGRALNVPLEVVNAAARLIPTEPKPKPIKVYVEDNPELKSLYETRPDIRQIVDVASHLQGVNRHASMHAAGVIVGDKPLVEYMPLHRLTGHEAEDSALKAVTQFPMETCESIGLLKIDFLGLSTLTIMRKACDLIERYHGIQYTMDNILYRPNGDPDHDRKLQETFAMIGRGETVGVFQVESGGMRQMLKDMRPTKFEHIIAAVSLYRPGPMDFIPQYNRRLRGDEQAVYRHPLLEAILAETFGICISGDSVVFDAFTGKRYRIDELENKAGSFHLQGIDENYMATIGRVTHWINNGVKPVYRITLRTGANIKATLDHSFLTEGGWKKLAALQPGDYVATPSRLIEPKSPISFDRDKLRVLAYLIADGSLSTDAAVDFVNKDSTLIKEYVRCVGAFENVEVVYLNQIRNVTRVMTKNRGSKGTSSLLAWMRKRGLKYPPSGRALGGCRSQEKFIPDFVFQLDNDDLVFFLASLWDCDGYMGRKICHYKTISDRLAYDVQTLLLRLGVPSVIHRSSYVSTRGERQAYQVTVYDTFKLAELLQPHMVTEKRHAVCVGNARPTIARQPFMTELDAVTTLSRRELMSNYGIDRQHFYKSGRQRERISANVVHETVKALSFSNTARLLNIRWEEVDSIELVGNEYVYDLTVEGLHNFVANGIVVHNCVYQEQIMQIASSLFGYELGEADLMRRAVSKKKEKDLKLHRDIFVQRGPERGIDEDTANKIFDDIEFFANYGFNKSHAADYAVITCQTAYLKAHYRAEYMTALLSVHRDDIGKIAVFLSECDRMDIPILPPDVNHSQLDFDIQTQDDGTRGIRFGLVAVKNAGAAPLEHILEVRAKGGPFSSVEDFCRRVDLRLVQKRTLESLIKAGALRALGRRSQLLAVLDRMLNFSAEHHRAVEVGQMSMFGGGIGASDSGLDNLSDVAEVSQREMLAWEKELLGFYVTSHPIDEALAAIPPDQNLITTYDLKDDAEALQDRQVKIVGLVAGMRKIITRNNEIMCVVQLEDRQGTIDVVMFPRTWDKVQDKVIDGGIILVQGKADARNRDPQIICEMVTQDLNILTREPVEEPASSEPPLWFTESEPQPWLEEDTPFDEDTGDAPTMETPPEINTGSPVAPATQGAAAVPTPVVEPPLVAEPVANGESSSAGDDHFVIETEELAADDSTEQRWLMVYYQRSGDDEKDRRRIRKLHGILTSYPGQDRFTIVVEGRKQSLTMEFPNHTTAFCDDLIRDLMSTVGEDNIRVFERPA